VTFQIEVGVLKTMIKTTPVEYVSTTLNTALKGAAFHLRAARGRELRGGVPAMDWSCMKVLTTAQFLPTGGVPARGSVRRRRARMFVS
jgi:hypothetical protein